MDWFEKVKSHLNERRQKLLKSIEYTKKVRDDAPTATESRSDTTRSQNERLLLALQKELTEIDKIINTISLQQIKYYEIEQDGQVMKIVLVPEGAGGGLLDTIKLISENSPLGQMLKGRKLNESFVLNDKQNKILKIGS